MVAHTHPANSPEDCYATDMPALPMHEARAIVARLRAAAHTRNGTVRAADGMASHLKGVLIATVGGFTPFGGGNSKTGTPGFYRPTGATCPHACPAHPANDGDCYTLGGNVNLHQRRAHADPLIGAATAAACMVWGLLTRTEAGNPRIARAHVSGDMGKAGADQFADAPVDWAYVEYLATFARAVRAEFDLGEDAVVMYTYTAYTGETRERIVSTLRAAGVYVRRSNALVAGGAVILPHTLAKATSRTIGLPVVKCPAQLRSVSCADCGLCWTDRPVVIAFDPHGAKARTGRERAATVYATA